MKEKIAEVKIVHSQFSSSERSGPEGNGGHSRLLRDFYNNIKSVVAVRCDHETRDREPKARRNEANGSNSKETTKVISSIIM